MKEITNKNKLGTLGEELVARLEEAILSEDRFDTKKDMIDKNGKFIEVKTQNRHKWKNIFSIREDKKINFNKCMNVDRLIFVEYDLTDVIKIYECTDRTNYISYETSLKDKMVGWPISKMKLLHYYENKDLAEKMRNLSNAKL